ncbi:MAG: Fic family protein [Gordonia sp. (in: high G+C Gram-positive bacteria)]|uniref:cell filamentation protein Fic n=1 Tax=Gordonia sp. (in: high G+C Gram-positive bacteria) TaxID=84139 RepID=UPI003C70C88D
MVQLTVGDLAGVVYSTGKVFDGLAAGRSDTESFLTSGSLAGIASRADLALLEDLRDVAQFIIDHADRSVDADHVMQINATITRSGALHPRRLRIPEQNIGVQTAYGRHQPEALTEGLFQQLIASAVSGPDLRDGATTLFVELAKAQPFEDGDKRTAVFAANSLLIGADADVFLTIPVDDDDLTLAAMFNDELARAYVFDEYDEVKELLRTRGLVGRGMNT